MQSEFKIVLIYFIYKIERIFSNFQRKNMWIWELLYEKSPTPPKDLSFRTGGVALRNLLSFSNSCKRKERKRCFSTEKRGGFSRNMDTNIIIIPIYTFQSIMGLIFFNFQWFNQISMKHSIFVRNLEKAFYQKHYLIKSCIF